MTKCSTLRTTSLTTDLTGLLSELLEEPLVEDEGDAADLLHFGLSGRVSVFKVGRDGDRQLPSELFTPETCESKDKYEDHFRRKETSRLKFHYVELSCVYLAVCSCARRLRR